MFDLICLSFSPSLSPSGGSWVVSDPDLEAGTAASAAAVGAAGEPQRFSADGAEVHQRHARHHHPRPRLRLHRRQVRHAAAAEPPARAGHPAGRLRAHHILEELGAATLRHRPATGYLSVHTHTLISSWRRRCRDCLGLVIQSSRDTTAV